MTPAALRDPIAERDEGAGRGGVDGVFGGVTAPPIAIRRDDPLPVYYQIAHAIRWRIGTGAIAPGTRLPSVRQGAEAWGVNLHTVRHAYRYLGKLALVESRPGVGTTVVGTTSGPTAASGTGMGATTAGGGEPVTVVECNAHQSRDLAAQIGAYWGIATVPWLLDSPAEPPPGRLIGTRFHEGEMRRRWPSRRADFSFVTLRVDPAAIGHLRTLLGAGRGRAVLCERDVGTGREMAADVARLASNDLDIEVTVAAPPDAFEARDDAILLVAPRRWDEVPFALRGHEACVLLRHIVDPTDLKRLGGTL